MKKVQDIRIFSFPLLRLKVLEVCFQLLDAFRHLASLILFVSMTFFSLSKALDAFRNLPGTAELHSPDSDTHSVPQTRGEYD